MRSLVAEINIVLYLYVVDIARALGRSITIVSRYGIKYYVVSLKTRDTQYRLVSVILSPALRRILQDRGNELNSE